MILVLLVRRQVVDLLAGLPADDLPVRRQQEAKLIDPRHRRHRADQADVRAFRRLDRADPAVVRVVDVPDLQLGALAGETARAQRREPPLVRQLRQRVGLVHKLRQLAAAEEALDRR